MREFRDSFCHILSTVYVKITLQKSEDNFGTYQNFDEFLGKRPSYQIILECSKMLLIFKNHL